MEDIKKERHRVTATIDDGLYQTLVYWAKRNQMSINEFLRESILHMIEYQNKDYDLPTLEIQRLNQIIDVVGVLSNNVESLENVVVSGFDSLLGLTRGDNYLLESESGDL